MGAAKRRREFIRGAMQMQDEGQGVFTIESVWWSDVPALFAASDAGDAKATAVGNLIGLFLKTIAAQQPPALCLFCDNELSQAAPPPLIVIMAAHRDSPSMAIVNGVCVGCVDQPELEVAVLAKYREILMPDLRRLPVFSRPGRA